MSDNGNGDGELTTGADIAAARAALLSDPPPIIDVGGPEATPEPTDDDLEAAALDDLTQPPEGGGEGAPAPAPAPAAPGTVDPYAAYGGEEAVRVAHQVQEALRTESGIRVLVANGLTALGYDAQQIKTALDAYDPAAGGEAATTPQSPAPADPLAGLEDDDAVPVSAVKALVAQAAQQAAAQAVAAAQSQVQPVQQAIAEQRQQQVRNVVDGALAEALGQIPADDPVKLAEYLDKAKEIEQRAAAYFDPTQWSNPAHIRQAVQHANADITARDEARFKAYIASKKAARDSQPPNTGGGAGSDGPLPEPKSLKEAREQAKAAGFFA